MHPRYTEIHPNTWGVVSTGCPRVCHSDELELIISTPLLLLSGDKTVRS